ncbi:MULTISPECIES: helix-turn-helix transcriptional regulator [Streptococcus]|uniref:helix-turn-helix transcriptional regulator n=1 Tax=Streptococcus sp. UMB0029 TaxID=2069308 RepID=UPI000C8088B9|nr:MULTISPECIES: helix-turn-helix transcriptional regulator [Streptococcus]MDK7322237.1 helix-turn-helix transcriptional regulator [Streptococcus mitis]PMC00031.1 XRE family transcriptional regulator [Streptococcus sp. UMB0029]
MNELGEKVRILREEKGLSRPVFCGDESELSVRQLVRIEKGEFRPTIKTLEYIAERLEIPSYVLMPDYKELPKRYQELKYFLLHHPDYGDEELQEQKEEYFDEIFENFYDDLPRDEKMIVDCLQAIDEVRATDNEQYGIALLDESFEELWNQREFSFSDLLKIRLYFLCSYLENIKKGQLSISEQQKLQLMFQKVCNNVENSGTDDLFLVRDVLFAGLGSCELLNDLELFKLAVEKLNWISEKTRDFQKQPIVLMVEWKYYIQTDYDTAKQKYEEAKMMARMFGNEQLIVSLDKEWTEDNKRF